MNRFRTFARNRQNGFVALGNCFIKVSLTDGADWIAGSASSSKGVLTTIVQRHRLAICPNAMHILIEGRDVSTFIRSGISNRSFMPGCCAFATSFRARCAYNEFGGDLHVRRIRSRKEPASGDPARSATACGDSRWLAKKASGAHC
jgi:hypothetical protein